MLQTRRKDRVIAAAAAFDHLKPVIKAYALGYFTSTAPRLPAVFKDVARSDLTLQQKFTLVKFYSSGSVGWNRFPTSCALMVAGSSVLPPLLKSQLSFVQNRLSAKVYRQILEIIIARIAFICSFASAWYAFKLLNKDKGWARKRANSRATQMQLQAAWESPNQHHLPPPGYQMQYAGKTIDFTLFALCRALDVFTISMWLKSRGTSWHPETFAPRLTLAAKRFIDPCLFSMSSAIIMWSWFYSPERLPKTYNQWISKVAGIDLRLIQALRLCRQGDLTYGREGTQNADLPALCKDLNLPEIWGNPAKTVPIPCELYHCGAGKSCEVHAISRFYKTFRLAVRLYLPLQLLGILRKSRIDKEVILKAFRDATRSPSFLASFVSLFYYSVCLARTRLGSRIFSKETVTPQMWDSGLCVLAGCLVCGWSILLEKASRRQDIAFFVAPRALATLLPRVYDKQYQNREQLVFATSVAIVMNSMQSKSHHVRGVLGKVLETVMH